MRINTNIMALNAQNKLTGNQGKVEGSIKKLSSGLRINGAADDASGLAISEKMRSQIRGLNQAQSNAQDGISMIQTAEGALQQTTDILQRMRELVVKAQNTGVLTSQDQSSITTELTALKNEVDRIASSTTFNTKKLLNGDLEDAADAAVFKIGANTDAVDSIKVTIGAMDATSLQINALDITTAGGASTALTKLDAAINTVSSQRAKLGAVQNRMEYAVENLSTTSENLTAAESRIRDVDMASEMVSYTKNSILNQSAMAMLAQANQQPQAILSLLR
ncbi:MAG: flagellin [Clostridia bacterium]|nr:flagellin [Clostridia bacterium]